MVRPALPCEPPAGLASFAALMRYEGTARELVARLKYRNARSAVAWLAAGMAELVDADEIDVVTWVPTTPSRRRQRGFDQGRVLATAVGRRLHRPCRPFFRRREGPSQTGRSRLQRLNGPDLVVHAWGPPPPRVLLVDDVVTTGATMTAAAQLLHQAGTFAVHGVSAAHRPSQLEKPFPQRDLLPKLKAGPRSSDAMGT